MRSRALLLIAAVLVLLSGPVNAAASIHPVIDTPQARTVSTSFEPFTIADLLHFRLSVDVADVGKPIGSTTLNAIMRQASELRGLPLSEEVAFVERKEKGIQLQMLVEVLEKVPKEEYLATEKLMVALGFLSPEDDLRGILVGLYSEQVAGAYDPDRKEVTVVSGKSLGKNTEELTVAHEVIHVLQDQAFDLRAKPLHDESYNGDAQTAILALIEGDAEQSTRSYGARYLGIEYGSDKDDMINITGFPALESAPQYISESLLFPYTAGRRFVNALIKAGGQEAVNQALKDPPLSTELILHPEKYLAEHRDNPAAVVIPDLSSSLGKGFKLIKEECLGEFDIDLMFREYYGSNNKAYIAAGWGGNSTHYYDNAPAGGYVLASQTLWDKPKDASEFYNGFRKLLEKRFGDRLSVLGKSSRATVFKAEDTLIYLGSTGGATLMLHAPSSTVLDNALSGFPEFQAAPW